MSADITLKEYLESQVRWLDRHVEGKIQEIYRAVDKAEITLRERTASTQLELSKRLDGMNEFRETLKDQAAQLVTRGEYALALKSVEDKLQHLELNQAETEGRARVTSFLIAVATSIVIGVLTFAISRWLFVT